MRQSRRMFPAHCSLPVFLFALLLSGGSALTVSASGPAATAASPQTTAPAAADDGVVGTRRAVTGSQRKERVCTTAAERAQARDKAQADLHQAGRCAGNEVACRSQL